MLERRIPSEVRSRTYNSKELKLPIASVIVGATMQNKRIERGVSVLRFSSIVLRRVLLN